MERDTALTFLLVLLWKHGTTVCRALEKGYSRAISLHWISINFIFSHPHIYFSGIFPLAGTCTYFMVNSFRFFPTLSPCVIYCLLIQSPKAKWSSNRRVAHFCRMLDCFNTMRPCNGKIITVTLLQRFLLLLDWPPMGFHMTHNRLTLMRAAKGVKIERQ